MIDFQLEVKQLGAYDNVHVASDTNVIGRIHLGNDVTIEAGTTVVRDVPDNTLVVSQTPRYINKVKK